RPVLPEGYQTLASLLKAGGYDTGLFGKWHLGSKPEWGPNNFGFDYSYGSLAGGKVRDYMSPVAFTITPGMDLFTIAQIFLAANFASLPVIEEGALIGRISRQDMLRGIQRLQRAVDVKRTRDGQALEVMQNPESVEELQKLAGSQSREQMAAVLSRRHSSGKGT
ncbi:MAG: sulfatase-like hydrolase/transferase, partial [bacterium]|nr:sulfatase-like hydrolase/transferase [bacterium]